VVPDSLVACSMTFEVYQDEMLQVRTDSMSDSQQEAALLRIFVNVAAVVRKGQCSVYLNAQVSEALHLLHYLPFDLQWLEQCVDSIPRCCSSAAAQLQ